MSASAKLQMITSCLSDSTSWTRLSVISSQRLRRKHHGKREGPVVLRHRRHGDLQVNSTLEPIKDVERQGTRELSCAIRSEIEEDHAVAIADRSDRLVVGIDDRARFDELVGDTGYV
jgi:hypothetical protein